jgi:hypothetical protein
MIIGDEEYTMRKWRILVGALLAIAAVVLVVLLLFVVGYIKRGV